jgi:hypothetical protein
MRVATTQTGTKIHIIDPTMNPSGEKTACGRREWRSTYIKFPKAVEVCQVCAYSMWMRIGRMLILGGKNGPNSSKPDPSDGHSREISGDSG